MTWADRFATVIEDEAGQAALEAEWRAAYAQAFVAIALRRGWNRENAASWPGEPAEPALIEAYRFDWDPARAAAFDVEAFEEGA